MTNALPLTSGFTQAGVYPKLVLICVNVEKRGLARFCKPDLVTKQKMSNLKELCDFLTREVKEETN